MKNLKKVLSVTAAAAMVMTTVAPVSVFADDATFKIGGIGACNRSSSYLRTGSKECNRARYQRGKRRWRNQRISGRVPVRR